MPVYYTNIHAESSSSEC